MRLTSRTLILTCIVALAAACSNTSDKGGIPHVVTPETEKDKAPKVEPTPVPKVIDHDSPETVSFTPRVDILFVVDDSGSMQSHQGNLSRNIALFTKQLSQTTFLDYHIGVVTTSMDHADPAEDCDNPKGYSARACGDGRLVRYKTNVPYIDSNTPGGLHILEQNLLVGTNGAGEEMIFDPIVAALTDPLQSGVNAGFLRKDATLAIVMLTDAEDQSHLTTTGQDLFDLLVKLKGGHQDKVLGYGAIIPSAISRPSCERDDPDATPVRIEEFLKLTKGLEFNICDPDYGSKLAQISSDVVEKVGRIMYLSRPPVPETIEVTYGTQIIPNDRDSGWMLDTARNALVFGEKIVLTQQPSGTQLQVTFTPGVLDIKN